jgi:hypothetical protein
MHTMEPARTSAGSQAAGSAATTKSPSSALLAGAFAGLVGLGTLASACTLATEASDAVDLATPTPAVDAATPEDTTYNRKISDKPVTFAEFSAICEKRGGFVQTHATCAGNNACRGISYLDGVTTEHSCKGMNHCGPGMSCVDLQKDSGLSGKDVYEKGTCAQMCHGQFSPSYDPSVFVLYLRPGGLSATQAEERFKTGSRLRLLSIVAFGSHGVNDDGTAYANMPAFYAKYSRAEIERVVDYARTLKIKSKTYEIVGP